MGRLSAAWLTTECWKDDRSLAVVRAAILGDSAIVSTDSEKLAVVIRDCKTCRHDGKQMLYPGDCTSCTPCGDESLYRNLEAKEIQK